MTDRTRGYRRPASVLFLLGCAALTAAAFQQANTGLVGYWKFDETSGTVAKDSSGSGNALAYLPTPAVPIPSTDVPTVGFTDPESLSFDGTSTCVAISTLTGFPTGNTPHTTAAWVKVTALPTVRAWILLLGNAAPGAEHWLIDNAGNTQFGVWGGAQVSPPLDTTWHHVALTFDGTTLTGYMDGSPIGSPAATYNFAGVPLSVAQAHNSEDFFNGLVDDLRIYNRALDSTEVAALASGASGPAAPTGLTAVPVNSQVNLNWNNSTGPGTVTYTVARSSVMGGSPPGTYTPIASGLTTDSYVDSPGTSGTYYYVVYADSFGEGGPSNEATATLSGSVVQATGGGKGGMNCHASAAQDPGVLPFVVGLGILALVIFRRR